MRRVLFFTGSGISAPSDISTFRDNEDGLWTKYDPMVVANMSTFATNRELVFKFYNERRVALKHVSPNKAHIEIGKIQQQYGTDAVLIFTQNVDDLFERANCHNVKHIHGDIKKVRCMTDPSHITEVGYSVVNHNDVCTVCGGDIKPAVVFFGEEAPLYWETHMTFNSADENDLIVVIGTAGNVVPLQYIVGSHQRNLNGGRRVLCNLDDNDNIPYDFFDHKLFGNVVDRTDELMQIIHDWMDK